MKKLIKSTLLAALVTIAGTTQAAEFKNWHCTTDAGVLIAMYEHNGAIYGHVDMLDGGLNIMGTRYEGETVSYGYELFRNGATSYVRFAFPQNGREISWVIMSGEVPRFGFQGARAYVDGVFQQEFECSGYVRTPIVKHPLMTEDSDELISHYGQITID